jgi:5'-3' exonuclease
MSPRPLLAVDAPFVMYRSFFALPDSIHGLDDRPVNALLGAVNVLLRIASDRDPRAVVICFGAEAADYRTELFPSYHADRPPVPDALAWQFEKAPELFEAFGWTTESSSSVEADDLLGSLASVEAAAAGSTLIVTGDRDMYQCVDSTTSVLMLKGGISGFEEIDASGVKQRYGVDPALVPDFIALRGDPSDGLPGVPGVGEKTAATLLAQHGSLEQILAAAHDPKSKLAKGLRAKLLAATDYIEAAGPVVRVTTDAPVTLSTPTDALPLAAADPKRTAELASALGVGSSIARLQKALDALPG